MVDLALVQGVMHTFSVQARFKGVADETSDLRAEAFGHINVNRECRWYTGYPG